MPRVLVIEDDDAVRMSLRLICQREGFGVDEARGGPQALSQFDPERHDLVLLDLMLPGVSGFEVLRAIRRREPRQAVVILTARGDDADQVLGLELGADDYVTKPFSPRALMARIRAVLRRTAHVAEALTPAGLALGGLRLDPGTRQATREGQMLALTRTEFDLLLALARAPGRVLPRDSLVAEVWGYETEGGSRLLDSHIAHLRAKLELDPRRPTYVTTVRGVGYALNAPGLGSAEPQTSSG